MAAGRGSSPNLTCTPLLFIIIIFFLFPIFYQLPLNCYAAESQRSLLSAADIKNQNQKQKQKRSNTNQIQNCNEIINQSHCNSIPKCRWCKSNVLDDMCSFKPQAWRLPSQIFTCD